MKKETKLHYYPILAGYKALLDITRVEGIEVDEKHRGKVQEFEAYIGENNFLVTDIVDTLDNYFEAMDRLMGKRIVEIPDNTFVFQLDELLQDVIREELYNAIEADGIYSEKEIHENVQRGMDSKISDLTDTINIYAIIEKFSK